MRMYALQSAAVLTIAVVGTMGCDPDFTSEVDDVEVSAASDAVKFSQSFSVPAHFNGDVLLDCSNAPGPIITLGGAIVFNGVDLQVTFSNNVKGTHENIQELSSDLVVLSTDETITIPKQPVHGGTGGNPHIWVQLLGSDGSELTGEIYLGRCISGHHSVAADLSLSAIGSILGTTADCSNSPGPTISFDGFMDVHGVNARFIFRNADNPVGGPHKKVVDSTLDIEVFPDFSVDIPKQPVLGGAGGNPLIKVQFLDGYDGPLTDEKTLGRCVQL